ncbi:hypothetical protein [Kutzneria buriramensis]|uniref:Uncharacterized protein n=1 Tax=Kutzneria buriramensis TaxID=1045776 RepID=A0A3E0HLI2_9PSEU|nr:hypothetical protein [Kutzneria buriramensis]REH47333.1 hypothetical protein BCF44_106498 [Kutzneria buriramensis]
MAIKFLYALRRDVILDMMLLEIGAGVTVLFLYALRRDVILDLT